ncbi:MAG TPA: hypothetical protein VFN57_08435 [Thermomicrobiaceae bacterium]|nr:hypothetical protein [Thermomicrobiaceae bacterium]
MAHGEVRSLVLVVHEDEPLIGLLMEQDGQPVERYVTDEAIADTELGDEALRLAANAIGALADLDWEDAIEELERIRHASPPTPPISL